MSLAVRLVLILSTVACCFYYAEGAKDNIQNKKQFPTLIKTKNKLNRPSNRRTYIIKCCGIKQCSGAHKKRSTWLKNFASSGNNRTTAKVDIPAKISIEPPGENGDGESNGVIETQITAKSAESSSAPETSSVACPRLNSCPSSCKKTDTLFNADGSLNELGKKGNWRSMCGNNYYFSSELGTWEENWARCCSLGLRPVWFKDASEMECLSKEVSNWTLNWNYWTGGTQHECKWAWCSEKGPDPLVKGLRWATGQPDNPLEACLHLRILKNTTGLVISDRKCSSKYVMACQGNPTMTKVCTKAECPNTECKKNPSLFTTNNTLIDYAKYGNWHNGCGREYLFANFSLSWNDAHSFCCSINTRLLSVERLDFLDCLTRMVDKYPAAKYQWALEKEFWTSGTSKGCAGTFEWCSKNKKLELREARWLTGHPKAEESCVFVSLFEKSSGDISILGTSACSEKKRFICEKPKRPTETLQTNLECLETWNLTDEEMISVQNASFDAMNAPRHIKCYVRCVVLSHGIFDFAAHQYSSSLLAILEDVSGDDDQSFQKGVGFLQDCSTKKKVDECETAAEVYGCNNEKNPALTSAAISSVNSSSPDTFDPSPVAAKSQCITTHFRTCPEKITCAVDAARRNDALANNTINGQLLTTAKGLKYFLVDIYQSFDESNLYCCQIGMKLATFETEEIFLDFVASTPVINSAWMSIGPTYDNGDNTDSWCENYQLIPTKIITDPSLAYGDCSRTKSSRVFLTNGGGFKVYDADYVVHWFVCKV